MKTKAKLPIAIFWSFIQLNRPKKKTIEVIEEL